MTAVKHSIRHQSLEEWRDEVRERLGNPIDPTKLAFECPHCQNVATAAEFKALGLEPDKAATECIGRHTDHDCDWCAFGLLGVLNYGRILETPDGGRRQVFEFADV